MRRGWLGSHQPLEGTVIEGKNSVNGRTCAYLARYLGMSALGNAKALTRVESVESVEPEGYGVANTVLMFLTSCDGVTPWEVVLLGIVPYRGSRGVSSRRHRSPFAKRCLR
jgi:hypothetical protein